MAIAAQINARRATPNGVPSEDLDGYNWDSDEVGLNWRAAGAAWAVGAAGGGAERETLNAIKRRVAANERATADFAKRILSYDLRLGKQPANMAGAGALRSLQAQEIRSLPAFQAEILSKFPVLRAALAVDPRNGIDFVGLQSLSAEFLDHLEDFTEDPRFLPNHVWVTSDVRTGVMDMVECICGIVKLEAKFGRGGGRGMPSAKKDLSDLLDGDTDVAVFSNDAEKNAFTRRCARATCYTVGLPVPKQRPADLYYLFNGDDAPAEDEIADEAAEAEEEEEDDDDDDDGDGDNDSRGSAGRNAQGGRGRQGRNARRRRQAAAEVAGRQANKAWQKVCLRCLRKDHRSIECRRKPFNKAEYQVSAVYGSTPPAATVVRLYLVQKYGADKEPPTIETGAPPLGAAPDGCTAPTDLSFNKVVEMLK